MDILKNIYFWLACLLYLAHQLSERNGISIPYVDNWLDDLLCIPVILGVTLFIQRKFTFKNPLYVFSWVHVLITVIYVSVLFELFLPIYSSKYTGDAADVIAYAIGGCLFYFLINVKPDENKDVKINQNFNKK